MPVRLAFLASLIDSQGDVVPSQPFYVYPTKAAADADAADQSWDGTGAASLVDVNGVALSQPLSTDTEGQKWFYSETHRKLIGLAVGSTRPFPLECVEDPDWSDTEAYPSGSPDGTDDKVLFWSTANGRIEQCSIDALVAAGPAPAGVVTVSLDGSPVSTPEIIMKTGAFVVGDLADGDIGLRYTP